MQPCSCSLAHALVVLMAVQVTILGRRPDDELLLLASDGLWDVLSNQEACTLAKRCLRRARQRGASRQSAARIAATVLTRAAVDRGSRDNVTVVVVDLSTGGSVEGDALNRAPSAAAAVGTDDGGDESLSHDMMVRSRSHHQEHA
jgi:serine/threonine protein phosphatase PrpC